jgi:hypothetical protein
VIRHASSVYGTSLEGIPLHVSLPDEGRAEIVILAAIHGDEAETTVAVSEALVMSAARRSAGGGDSLRQWTACCAGARQRSRDRSQSQFPDVELASRPSSTEPRERARDIALSPGAEPASARNERCSRFSRSCSRARSSSHLHSPVSHSGASTSAANADRCALPFSRRSAIDAGLDGHMGERAGLNLVTLELEDASLYTLKDRHVPILIDLMTGRFELA